MELFGDTRVGKIRFSSVVGFLFVAVATGCESGGRETKSVVCDSAGVTIVESLEAAWPEGSGWKVADDPFFSIGSAEGSAEYQFHRIEKALRVGDDRIVVADGGSGEIRFFDSTGGLLRVNGGTGDAPGEYRMISGLGSGPGDSLWVYDYGNRRFTVLTREGETVRTVSVGGFLSAAGAVGRLPDGSFVVKEGWGRGTGSALRVGLTRDPIAIAVFDPDGLSPDTLGMFPGSESFISIEDGRGVMSTPLFAHNTSAAIRGDEVFVGVQEQLQVGLYTRDGVLRQLFRAPNVDLHLTTAAIEARKQQVISQMPAARQAEARHQLEEMDVPDSRPAYGTLLVGADGSLWAGEQVRYPAVSRTWTVFGSDGRLLGPVVMPDRFKVLQVGHDWILGVGLDDLDVEHVQLYRLEK